LDFVTSEKREISLSIERSQAGNASTTLIMINWAEVEFLALFDRYPTRLRALKAVIDGTVEAKSNQGLVLFCLRWEFTLMSRRY
jgi:hypothetical protein